MKYDEILVQIGEFGPYQKRIIFLLILPCLLAAAQTTILIFMTSIPNHRCKIPGYPTDTYDVKNPSHENMINTFVPTAGEDKSNGAYSKCFLYSDSNLSVSLNFSLEDVRPYNENQNRTTHHCSQWVYDTSEFVSTMMTEFDAVCDDKFLRSFGNSVSFAGSMCGSVLMGIFTDVFGRKKGIMLSIILQLISALGVYFPTNLYLIIGVRFISGIATRALFAISCMTAIELVGPNTRTFAGMAPEFSFVLGVFLVIPIAYLLPDWRNMQLVICVATVPYLALWWLLPESPRWLLKHEKHKEAKQLLEKICTSNKTHLPQDAIDEQTTAEGPKEKISKMFTHKVLLIRTLVIFFNWFACSVLYYGLNLNVDNLAGSLYLNYFLIVLVEAVAYVICLYLLNKTGRKKLYCAYILMGGFACLATMIPVMIAGDELQWVTISLALIGKLGSSGAYAVIYIMSAELFPTVLRSSAIGFCSIFESFGGVVAPILADLGVIVGGPFAQALPMVIFGIVSVIAGCLAILLPETLNKKLPETIQDAIDFGKDEQEIDNVKSQNKDTQSLELMNTLI